MNRIATTFTALCPLLAACVGQGDSATIGSSESNSTEYRTVLDALNARGLRCEDDWGTSVAVAPLAGRADAPILGGTGYNVEGAGSCSLRLQCDVSPYSYWPSGGSLTVALPEFSVIANPYTDGTVHANLNVTLAHGDGGSTKLECTTPERPGQSVVGAIDETGLTCMTKSQNKMLHVYELNGTGKADLMFPEQGGHCSLELDCELPNGGLNVKIADFARSGDAGATSYVNSNAVLTDHDGDASPDVMTCRTGP